MSLPQVTLITDGACSGNPGPGGWGVLLKSGAHEKVLSGGERETTNNRMELIAVIEGLKALKKTSKVLIITDSRYVLQGMSEWIHGWIKNGWRTANRKAVVNQDLWLALYAECQKHRIEWQWVKGHSGHPDNERVDELARLAIPKI